MRLSLSNSFSSFLILPLFPFLVSISGFSASPRGARGWIDHLSWLEISNPCADNGWHGWISISSGRHANVCAPGSTSGCTWRSCEGSAFSPATLLPPQGVFALTIFYVSCSLHHFFLYVDRRVKLPLVLLKPSGNKKYGMKCHTTLSHVVVQLTPKY